MTADLHALVREVSDRRRAWESVAVQAVKQNAYTMRLLLLNAQKHADAGDAKGVYNTLQAINDLECNHTGDCTVAGDATEQLRKVLGIEDE